MPFGKFSTNGGRGCRRASASLLLPFLVAFVLRGRKGDWKGFSKWFFWVTVIMLYAVYWNHHQLPPTSAGRY